MSCSQSIQANYIAQIHERNTIEKAQFKEVVQDYMSILKQLKKQQEEKKILEKEMYIIRQTKGYQHTQVNLIYRDAVQIMKLE